MQLEKIDTDQTGIKGEDLNDKPDALTVLKMIDKSCAKKNFIFIAQNAHYEANILSHYTNECKGIAKTPILDTILLAKNVFPNLQNYKLDTLAKTFGLKIPKDRHRALPDCFLTAQVFLCLLKESQNKKNELIFLDDLLHIAEIKTKYNKPQQIKLW